MEAIIGICIAFCCALAAGAIAQKKKRNGTVWAWLAFLCAPLILLLLILPSKAQPWEIADDDTPSGNMIATGRQITIERRQRGLFGRIVAVLFWGWQVVMGAWLITYWGQLDDVYNQSAEQAQRVGVTLGGTVGISIILWVWLFGAIILGLMMLFTRGEKVTITRMA